MVLAPSLLAGLVSATLYALVTYFGLGFLFLFLPSLPIFWLGLSGRSDASLHAVLIATLLLAFLSNPWAALFLYFLCIGFPAWYMSRESMQHGQGGGMDIWFPMTVILARLMTAASLLLLAVTLYYLPIQGGLPALLTAHLQEVFSHLSVHMEEAARDSLQLLAPKLVFLVFAVSAWMWAGCLYLHSWVVHRELRRQKMTRRPDMVIAAFPPPNWIISLLLISAVALLIGGESIAFWGRSSLIILLFPYFLFGMALLHLYSRRVPQRALLLGCSYVLMALQLWPVLLVAVCGIIYHISLLNKYLSSGGTSSRS